MRFSAVAIVALLAASGPGAHAQSGARLLVLLRNASALAFLEPASGKVLGRVPVVADPHEVAVTPDGRTAFVVSPREGISAIDVPAMKELRRVDPQLGGAAIEQFSHIGSVRLQADLAKSG